MAERPELELAAFLRARFDEDWAEARGWRSTTINHRVTCLCGEQGIVAQISPVMSVQHGDTFHVAADKDARGKIWDQLPRPADRQKQITDLEAKLQIVEMHTKGRVGGRVLRLLATPYADHPHYQESWRP